MHILIDGYNYLHAIRNVGNLDAAGFERERDKLVQRFATYRYYRPNDITVVFDGTESLNLYRGREDHQGIKVVFSAQGENADRVIMEKAEPGNLVVTADREIIEHVLANGAETIPPLEFDQRVAMAAMMDGGEKDDDYDDRPTTTKKKGNPRRKSKKERRKNRFLDKL